MILGLDGCAVSVGGLNRSPTPSHGSVAAWTGFRLLHRQEEERFQGRLNIGSRITLGLHYQTRPYFTLICSMVSDWGHAMRVLSYELCVLRF